MSGHGQIGDALTDAINAHTLDGILRLYSPQAVLVAPGGMAEGHDQIAAYYGHVFDGFPDIGATLWRKITTAGVALYEWTLTGTHLGPFLIPGGGTLDATGRGVVVRACSTATTESDLIVSHQFYFDQLELFASLGVRLNADGPGN
ncbi:ester cyclase [Nonomuraea zeae]|uniref:Nuclear transport factor 2 family protein n=1 Tax=Nonomuraea zeae TaxID=1642303 RepID=A0A5S4GY44_9ACTN|nr:nuclear transport factor 2 family protein [Nonomuraea zeae]TMR37868.1 nuclear transport factor 2 family protein [Nonomuraea zeae]